MKITYKDNDGHLVIDKEIFTPVEFNIPDDDGNPNLFNCPLCARFNDAHDEYLIPMENIYVITE